MDAVFLKLLNMSITASWLILAVIAARFALKKAPKWMNCALWGLVGLRLLFPFSIESVFSLIPSAETVSPDIMYSQTPGITSGIPAINSVVNPVISGSFAPSPEASVNPLQIWAAVASYVWLIGIASMVIYAAVSYLLMRKKVKASIHLRDNMWICDDIQTPFILGVFKPRIYLPAGMDEETEAHVIAHENAHLKRRDHWWKPLGFLLLSVYWFNPVIWLAYILLCRDIELTCPLDDVPLTAPVYQAATYTSAECDEFGYSFLARIGETENIDVAYYDNETYYMDHSSPSHFLIVSHRDRSYEYSVHSGSEAEPMESDRETIVSLLGELNISVPDYAVFSHDGNGWHSFSLNKHSDGDTMLDGILRCQYNADGELNEVENHLVSYALSRDIEIISQNEAVDIFRSGCFNSGEFEYLSPASADISSVALEYAIDSKGYYQPVYILTVLCDGDAVVEVPISALD